MEAMTNTLMLFAVAEIFLTLAACAASSNLRGVCTEGQCTELSLPNHRSDCYDTLTGAGEVSVHRYKNAWNNILACTSISRRASYSDDKIMGSTLKKAVELDWKSKLFHKKKKLYTRARLITENIIIEKEVTIFPHSCATESLWKQHKQ